MYLIDLVHDTMYTGRYIRTSNHIKVSSTPVVLVFGRYLGKEALERGRGDRNRERETEPEARERERGLHRHETINKIITARLYLVLRAKMLTVTKSQYHLH